MNIQIFYDNGRIDEFDTENFTLPQPYEGANMLTNFEVRFDKLGTESLWLHAHYYDANPAYIQENPPGEVPVARRKMGWRFLLVDHREIDQVARIVVDGENAGWRQGGMFVNGIRFTQTARACCPLKDSASLNARAVALHDYLAKAHKELASDEEALCSMFGFSAQAYMNVCREEAAQPKKDQAAQDAKPEVNDKSWIDQVKEEKGK